MSAVVSGARHGDLSHESKDADLVRSLQCQQEGNQWVPSKGSMCVMQK